MANPQPQSRRRFVLAGERRRRVFEYQLASPPVATRNGLARPARIGAPVMIAVRRNRLEAATLLVFVQRLASEVVRAVHRFLSSMESGLDFFFSELGVAGAWRKR